MEVILADDYGFCYGVKRAIKTAKDNIDLSKKVCTLGPIIHNPQMVKSLADEGIGIVESVDEMENGKIIIRSHGVGPSIYDAIKAKGLELADATCPHVKKAQMSAKTLADEGFKVIIIGEKNHPEVKSIKEWAGKNSLVIGSQEEAENFIIEGNIEKVINKLVDTDQDEDDEVEEDMFVETTTLATRVRDYILSNLS